MATKSISDLTAAATLTGTEVVPIVQGSTTVKATTQAIANLRAVPVTSVAGRTGVVTLTKTDVGLGNVDNTSDANKPISTATQTALDAKVTSVAAKTGVVTLVKADVGLTNVDNTSDANKPVSTATQTALNAKANTTSNTFTQTQTLAAGTAALAPLKFQSGVTLTTPAAHSVEWDGTSMSLTNSSATRRRVALDGNWIYDTTTGLTGTYQFDAATYSGAVFNAVMTGTTVLNVRGDSSKTLASLLEIGQSIDITVITKSGITSYVLSITIDGVAPTIITPTVPTHTGFSYYRHDWTIIKTAASAFTVIALPQSYA